MMDSRIPSVLASIVLLAINNSPGIAAQESCSPAPWPATDALGRRMPMAEEVGPPRKDRFVGIFYFLWHERTPGTGHDGPPDISRILAKDPDALRHAGSPLWGTVGSMHYWGEPLYGYYLSSDAWVLRRHAQLLADAGIDTLIFDATNAVTYRDVYHELCRVFSEIRKQGGRTPQIAFMLNDKPGQTARQIYDDLYKPGLYRDLWFIWQGKPLMICDPKPLGPELRNFFTLRAAHWPFTLVNTPYAWHWEAAYPQVYGYTDDPNKPEEVNVSVAQNLRARDGRVTTMSGGEARGRSFHDGAEDGAPGAVDQGYNFAEQWRRALALDPPFVMVTGWNEWTAGRLGPDGPFVDGFNEEFSRDVEPMKGGHGDNYYYQLVENVRRFKGVPPIPKASPPKSIDVAGPFSQWRDVGPEFRNDAGDAFPRDYDGAGGLHYVNRSARNQLVAFKVARDAKDLYFYACTRRPLTPRTDPNWMWLLINTQQHGAPAWEGYNFIVNRRIDADGTCWLERNEGGWNWKKLARVRVQVAGNGLQLALPRAVLGIPAGKSDLTFDFKWADNLQRPGDVMDFYIDGDVAPAGRFVYRFEATNP